MTSPMTSFIPVAPCVRRWTQSIRSVVLRASNSLYGRSRPSRAPIRPDYVGKKLPTATHEQIQVRLQEIDNEPCRVAGKTMTVTALYLGSARGSACWRARPRHRNFSVMFKAPDVVMHKARLFRRDTETSTRAACAPQIT